MSTDHAGPLYYTVKRALEMRIADLEPHTAIPTERALAVEYDTSRTTVRRAVTELVAEGRLSRIQGSGTFVAPPKHSYVRQLTSFSEDADSQGRSAGSKILDISHVVPDEDTSTELQLPPGRKVHRIERVRLLDGVPHAHEVAFLAGRFPRLKSMITEDTSLYALLTSHYNVRLAEVRDEVETALASPAEAAILRVEVGTPLLVVHRLAKDHEGIPVEFTRSRFRGDRSRFVARLKI